MSHHPLCDRGRIIAATLSLAAPATAAKLAELFADLAPMEAFANETVSDAQADTLARFDALYTMRVPGGAR